MHAWINITHPGFSGRQDMPDDCDQWVSWEQMVAQIRAKGEAEGRSALLAREVVELRGEVAKLKPLEMILLKEDAPLQRLYEAILDLSAKVRRMEEVSRIRLQESFETRGKLEKLESMRFRLCAALSLPADSAPEMVAEAVEARRVVVPEFPESDFATRELLHSVGGDPDFDLGILQAGYNLAASRVRAIPADRVLGEGMIQVSAEGFKAMRIAGTMLANAAYNLKQQSSLNPGWRASLAEGQKAWDSAIEALCANQGGIEHGNG